MSNNKQMKLYTEEQVRHMLGGAMQPHWIDEFLLNYKHIQLPSDEEIKEEMGYDAFDPYDIAYYGGIDYMRKKIQGGNK